MIDLTPSLLDNGIEGGVTVTIQVEVSPETEARLAAQAAARSMEVSAYAASLLEDAAVQFQPTRSRPAGRKSLAQLFAESPFKGLDMDFEREQDSGRDLEL